MERILALDARFFGFAGFIALVARIQQALEHVLRFCNCPRIDSPRLDNLDRRSLYGAGASDLVAAFGKNDVIESATR